MYRQFKSRRRRRKGDGGGAEEERERRYRNSAIETYSNLYGELIVIETES